MQILHNLNAQQAAAVTADTRSQLILAGAGSGKTRVLITRIAWLIQSGLAAPAEIMAVTFTNKAAKEMLTRLTGMLPLNPRNLWVGTFHGLCNRLLRIHCRDAGLPETFQILDSGDQLSAIKRLMKSLNIDDKKFPPREVQYFINSQKEAGIRAGAVEVFDGHSKQKAVIYQEYENQCQREGVVDFSELLLRAYELLQRNEPIRHHYIRRFRHILVDEFQDTNKLQYQWLKLLAGFGSECQGSLFCVGDDDQSIYGFRGADISNMRDFEREFEISSVIRLEQNYRSFGNILNAANALIHHNTGRLGKELWTDQGEGELIRVYEGYSDQDEARFIVEEVGCLVRDGVPRSDIALLYRSNAQSRVLEHQLVSAGIPYRVYGGLRFFERQEIKHALAYLRLLANPDDDTAFSRVVNFPVRGIGARSLEQLQDAARTWNTSLYAAVPHLSGAAGSKLGQFVRLIESVRQEGQALELPELVDHVLERSGLRAHYQLEREGEERLANLDELMNAAATFIAQERGQESEQTFDGGDLAAFLAHASLEAGDNQAEAGQEAVQLMTVHAAKGLEFDVVFMTGLEEGLFPHENSLHDPDNLEEERRLMYVAVTRARQRLYLTLAQSRMLHGQVRYNLRSQFLDEIPESVLKWLTPKERRNSRVERDTDGGGWGESRQSSYGQSWQEKSGRSTGSVPRANAASQTSVGGLRVGQQVGHARFGMGTVLGFEGSGADAKVQIKFAGQPAKWLMLSVAKLEHY